MEFDNCIKYSDIRLFRWPIQEYQNCSHYGTKQTKFFNVLILKRFICSTQLISIVSYDIGDVTDLIIRHIIQAGDSIKYSRCHRSRCCRARVSFSTDNTVHSLHCTLYRLYRPGTTAHSVESISTITTTTIDIHIIELTICILQASKLNVCRLTKSRYWISRG